MAGQNRDDRDAVDRAFAEMIAGYHLTAEREARSELERDEPSETEPTRSLRDEPGDETGQEIGRDSGRRVDLDNRWADQHPLFSFTEPAVEPEPEPAEERYEPGPPPAWPRPSAAVLVGWLGVAFGVVTMVLAALGVPVARWVGWTAVGAFVGGFALLLSRLPRHRPPESGDGAVL